MSDQIFGPPREWPDQDLIAFSTEFDPWLAAAAYRCGVFPMPLSTGNFADQMGWWSPVERGIVPIEGLRITRSLRQSTRRYITTIDTCFPEVLTRCADPRRPGGWIDKRITEVYLELHSQGVVHSVETWDDRGNLAGGLYGVSIGGLFAGESMFHHPKLGRDASKVALVRLASELAAGGCELFDVQWLTPHLESLGAISISRDEYLGLLDEALAAPAMRWKSPAPLTGRELLSGWLG